MTEQLTQAASTDRKRERSPSFPFISLEKALARMKVMEEKHKQFPTPPGTLANTWSLAPKSSTFLQTISAVKAFGLIDEQGTGKERRVKVSELARRILLDTRSGVREAAVKEAAKQPKLLREFMARWKDGRPSDDHCISELHLDHKFTREAAANFLKVYDETIRYANIGCSDSITDKVEGAEGAENPADALEQATVQVGDYVQWESQGQFQFQSPRRVTKVEHDDEYGWYVWVEGHAGAVPMEQIVAAETNAAPDKESERKPLQKREDAKEIFIERATMPLPEGVVALEFPSSMSQASFDDFIAWVEVIKKRAERSVK